VKNQFLTQTHYVVTIMWYWCQQWDCWNLPDVAIDYGRFEAVQWCLNGWKIHGRGRLGTDEGCHMLWLREGRGQSRRVSRAALNAIQRKMEDGQEYLHNCKCWPRIDGGWYEGQLRRNEDCSKCWTGRDGGHHKCNMICSDWVWRNHQQTGGKPSWGILQWDTGDMTSHEWQKTLRGAMWQECRMQLVEMKHEKGI
jgi:hypothetical protein